MEQLVPGESLESAAEAGNSMIPLIHAMIVDGQFGKLQEKEIDSALAKEDQGDGTCSVSKEAGSVAPQPSDLDSSAVDFTSTSRHLPVSVSTVNPQPSLLEAELHHECGTQTKSQGQAENYYLNGIDKEASQKRNNSIFIAGSLKASSADFTNTCISEQIQGTNENVKLDIAIRRSTRCAPASSVGQQVSKLPLIQLSRGNQDRTEEKEVPQEPPKEPVPPARKKTRTFYSAEQLGELERMFQEDHYPDNDKRREIATAVGVTPQRVMIWFQNRRAKWRKMEKLSLKDTKKSSAIASTSSEGLQQSSQSVTLLPVHPPSDTGCGRPGAFTVDAAGIYSGLLSEQTVPPNSASDTDAATPHDCVHTKTASLDTFQSLKEEIFPAIPSPPPIRRASLPLQGPFNPNSHIVPLMMDSPSNEFSPSSQESSSSEAFIYSIQNQSKIPSAMESGPSTSGRRQLAQEMTSGGTGSSSQSHPASLSHQDMVDIFKTLAEEYFQVRHKRQCLDSPAHCKYMEQLEPTGNLETSYCHPDSYSGVHQHNPYPQQVVSQVYHLPVQLTDNTPPTPNKSSTTFFSLPGTSGLLTYGPAEVPRECVQNHIGGHILIQPSAGNSGCIPTFQTISWNEIYVQGVPFSSQLCSQNQFPSLGGCATEQTQFTQNQSVPPGSRLLQVPGPAVQGSTLLFAAKIEDCHSQREQAVPLWPSSDTDIIPQNKEITSDFAEENED